MCTSLNVSTRVLFGEEQDPNEHFPPVGKTKFITKERVSAKLKKMRTDSRKLWIVEEKVEEGELSSPSIISVSLSREVPQLLRGFLQALILKMYRKKLNPMTSCPNEMTRKKLLLFLKLIKTGRSVKLDETTKKRRATVAEMLNNRKDKEIIQKLTSGAQFLNYAKEDHLELKRKLLDRLDKEDSDFKESMAKINKTMETVRESIS